jgi:hypothetical protein
MQKSAESILGLFNQKHQEGFSGGIKIGFEQGRPVNCSEYSNPEQDPPPIPADFNLSDRIDKACATDYYGSLLFVFNKGEITHFSYVRTWGGRGIDDLLSLRPAGGHYAKLSEMRKTS